MKNKIWVLLTIAGMMIAVMSCGKEQPEPDPIYCPDTDNDGNGHLGVGEDCIKDTGTCSGLQEYRTANMQNSTHADYFQWPIYRVGAKSHYQGTELTTTVNNILAAYKGLETLFEVPNLKNSSLEQVHITYNAPSTDPATEAFLGKFTWNKKYLGIQKGNVASLIEMCLKNIELLPEILQPAITQLQPAGNIRIAQGKKRTERFPAVAGGNGKLPRADRAATGFELNRQLIARNNRNVKNQWRQAQV